MQCPVHGVEFILKPAGVSKKTGKPYNAFYCCPSYGCNEKPPKEGGWPAVREQVAAKVAPEKASMTKEDWEAKEQRTNRNILLQVAFKATIEMVAADLHNGKQIPAETIKKSTLDWFNWLLSQTEGQKSVSVANLRPSEVVRSMGTAPSDDFEAGNRAIDDALAEEIGF